MTVSGIVEKANSQEMAVTLNQGALNQFEDKVKEKESPRRAAEIETSKLLEMKSKNLNSEIMGSLFSKLAAAGITLNPKANQKMNGEDINRIINDVESYEDKVFLKSRDEILKVQKDKGGGGGGEADGGTRYFSSSVDEARALLEQFINLIAEATARSNPDIAERIKTVREKLIQKGVSEEKLAQIEKDAGGISKKALFEALKDGVVMQLLSLDNRLERGLRRRGTNDIYKMISEKFSKEEADLMIKMASEAAKEEIRNFVPEELENVLIKKTYLQDTEFSDAVKLIKIGAAADFDSREWIRSVWPQKKEDHGLYLMDVPHAATGLVVNTSTDNPASKQKHGYEYEKEDEKELMLNRLRALYLHGAMKKGFFNSLETVFKIRKLKNGLLRLGVFTPQLDEQLKHEAEVLAKMKTMEMLREALLERATFYELAGPAHDLVERKIKGLLKNAERLGMPISTSEFVTMRDKANADIYALSKKELEAVRDERRRGDSNKLEKREKLLVRLLTRLAQESQISDASFSLVDTNK